MRYSFLNTPRALALFLLFGGAGPLLFAAFTQYGLGFAPCHYCMLQRYPYIVPMVAGALAFVPALRPHLRVLLVMAIVGWLTTAAIALRHVGIEQGWIVEAGGCSASALSGSVEDIRSQIMGAPLVACNAVSAAFLGISMATWNALCALGLCLAASYMYLKQKKDAHAL